MSKDIKKMLEEKLQQNNQRHSSAKQSVDFEESRELCLVAIKSIEPNPYQPRRIFPQAELDQLARSISEIGLLEPILVRKVKEGYQIAAGERRWRAHKILGKNTIESIVTDITDSDMAVFALAENIDREDLSDYEIGLALRQIESVFPTKKKLAESLGLNREDMYKYFSYDDLPEFIRNDLNDNPKLLSRAAASDIKRVLTKYKESQFIDACLKDAWSLLLASELDQTKITGYITKKIKSLEEGENDSHIQSSHNFFRDGKKVGSITWIGKHITVKLSVDVVNSDKEQQLKNFLESLVEGEIESNV